MTKEELIKKLDGAVVHCPTEEFAKKVLKIARKMCFYWSDKLPQLNWSYYAEKTCYVLRDTITYVSIDGPYAQEYGVTIIPATEFLSWFSSGSPSEPTREQIEQVRHIAENGCDGIDCIKSDCILYAGKCFIGTSPKEKASQWLEKHDNPVEKKGGAKRTDTGGDPSCPREQIISNIGVCKKALKCFDGDTLLCQIIKNGADVRYKYHNTSHTPEQAIKVAEFIKRMEGK